MFKMLRELFQQNRSQKNSRAINHQPARIEILEDRCLLAAFVGTSFNVAGGDYPSATGDHFHPGMSSVGQYPNSEEIRGLSEFNLTGATAVTNATLTFSVNSLSVVGGSSGPGNFTIAVEWYAGNNANDVSDYHASAGPQVGTFGSAGNVVGQTFSFDVTDGYNNIVGNTFPALGIRLRALTDPLGNGVTYSNFQVTTNNAPDISIQAGDSAAETIIETNSGLSVSGTLSVQDVDTADTVEANVDSVAVTGDANSLTNSTLLSMLAVGPNAVIDGSSTTGTIDWTFDSGSEAFDYLDNTESLVLEYTLSSTDSQNASDTESVTITINGTSDGPVAVAWDGGGTTSNWSEAANWTNDTVPATGDFVTIDVTGTPYTVNLDVDIEAGQTTEGLGSFVLNSSSANFSAAGQSFTVNGTSDVTAGSVTWDNSVWSGTQTLTVGPSASVIMIDDDAQPSQIDTPLPNNGTFFVRGLDNQFNSSIVVNAGTLTIQAQSSAVSGVLTVVDGLVNQGDIVLANLNGAGGATSRISVTSGTLVNEVGAIIEGRRTATGFLTAEIDAQLDNRGIVQSAPGTFDAPGSLLITKVGATHLNSGSIIASRSNLTVSGFDSFENSGTLETGIQNRTFQIQGQSQATSTFTNSGTLTSGSSTLFLEDLDVLSNTGAININNGSFSAFDDDIRNVNTINSSGDLVIASGVSLAINGGTFNSSAGATFAGTGNLYLESLVLDITGGLTVAPNLTLDNVDIHGSGSLTTNAITNMIDDDAQPSQIDTPLTNNGSFFVRGLDNQFNSSIVVNTGTLTIQAQSSAVPGVLTVADGMVNQGDIVLANLNGAGGATSRISVTSGTLVNEMGATIEGRRTATGFLTAEIDAQLDNRGMVLSAPGTFDAPGSLLITKLGAGHLNSGTIIASRSNLTVSGFDSFDNSGTLETGFQNRTFQIHGQSQATSVFTNSGTLSSGSGNLKIEELDVITNTGDINISNGNFSAFDDDIRNFNLFNNSGDIAVAANFWLLIAGGTINSTAPATMDGPGSIVLKSSVMDITGALSTSNLNLTLNNSVIQGSGTFTTGGSVSMFDDDGSPSRIDVPLTNTGTFTVRGADNQFTNSSVLNTGTLNIFTDNVMGNGVLTLSDGMVNQGDIFLRGVHHFSASARIYRLASTSGTVVNDTTGTITVEQATGPGSGEILAEIDNRGTITNARNLLIDKASANHLNSGSIAGIGGNLMISGFNTFENSGSINGGTRQILFSNATTYSHLATGQLLSTVEAEFNNVTDVLGVGTIATQVNAVASNVNPGLSPGVLNVVGNYLQNTNSSFTAEIGSNTAGTGASFHDQVNVTGTVTIGSNVSLNTTSFGGYVPAGGDSYFIINNDGTDAVSGTFVGLAEGSVLSTDFLGSGETAIITYVGGTDNNDVVISIVDLTPPAAPSAPDLDAGSDSGAFSTDDYTNVVLPTFSGTAEAGSTVELFSDVAGLLGTVSADVTTGAWSLTSAVGMADGVHNIAVTATDSSENVSSASMALPVTIDTSNPGIPAVTAITDDTATAGDGITSDNTLVISGSADPDVSVEVFEGAISIGSTTVSGTGIWSFDYSASVLADGTYNFTASATDLAGNASALSSAFVAIVDTAPPAVSAPNLVNGSDTGVSGSDDITADNTPTVSGTAEANAAIEVFDGASTLGTTIADGSGNWSITSSELLDGIHNLLATATDIAGNQSIGAALSVTIDTTPPAAPSTPDLDSLSDTGDSDVDDVTADNTPTISGTAEAGSTVEVFDGATLLGTTTASGMGSWTFTTPVLSDGIHNLSVNSTDTAGNVGLASAALEVSIDTEGPTVSINRAAGQPDMATTSPVNFEVVFSETTASFDSGDVAVSGTAGATTVVVTGSGTTYNVAVTGMTQGGSVIIDIATGAASDLAGNLSGAATIIDNEVTFGDAVYDFASASFADSETDSTHTSSVVEVARSGNTSIATSVNVVLTSINATAGTDFVAGPLVLNFAAGETSRLVPIEILGDATVELNESIELSLTGFSGTGQTGVTQPTATLEITNDDSATVSVSHVSQVETDAGQTAFLFNVTLSEQVDSAVSLQVNTADGSATVADNDYESIAGQTLNFTPAVTAGPKFQTVSVVVNGDLTIEADEAFDVVLSSLSASGRNVTFVGAAATEKAIGTIENDDSGLATISANVSAAAEGGSDGQFAISLSQPSDSPVDVSYSIGGTAGNGTDYALLSGMASFAANQTIATVDIAVGEDLMLEGSETVVLTLTSATAGISIGGASSDAVTISDNEVVTVEFVSTASSLMEATTGHDVQLQLVGAAGVTLAPGITVSVDVINGTGSAASGSDYQAFGTQTANFGPGSVVGAAQNIAVNVLDDGIVEPTETIGLLLNTVNGPGATAGAQTAHIATIVDNDTLTVEFNQATGSDLEADGGNLPQLLVNGDIQAGHSVSVDIAVTGGTATASDFVESTTLSVGSGSYSGQSFSIPSLAIIDDATVEADETIELGNITGSAVTVGSQATSTFTILDDDTTQSNDPPVITDLTSSNADVANKSDDGVVTINGTFDDVNVADVHSVTVDWGDGSALESIAVDQLANSLNGTHSYNDGGIYAITVTVDDGNNGLDSETTSAVVQGVGLVDGKLYIIGSDGHDWAKVRQRGGQLHADLWLKGHRHNHHRHWQYQSHTHKHFDPADVNEIVVIACDGHDGIDVWASSSIPVMVDAGNGHDSIWTAGSDDTVLAGEGNDYVRTYGGNDTIDAGNGNNVIHSGRGNDFVTTGNGNDCIHTESGNDVIDSGAGNDWIHSGDGDDIIFAGAGNDTVYAGDGNDIVFGGAGNDQIDGGNGNDLLFGGAGKDYLNGGRGHDILVGGDGRDTLCGGKGNDLLIGGSLETDWRTVFDESLLDTAIAEWATGDLADTMHILGDVLDDNDKDYLFGQQGYDTFITGSRDRWRQ